MALFETSTGTDPAASVITRVIPLVACGDERHDRADTLTKVAGTLVKLKRQRKYSRDALRDEKCEP
jgi:hypothetical protein